MAYDGTKPFDTGYLADAPEELRENFRALKEDQIVDAGTLSGLSAGNATGKIPISNGEVNQNLNADLLDGKNAADFAASVHAHASATTLSDGFLSAADKTKLDGIATGAEVNQNAFAGVAVGDVTISADSTSDTLIFKAGSGITLTADPETDTLTVTLGSHTHDYLPLSGGTVTGDITANKLNAGAIALSTDTPFVDFHFNSSSSDYTARLINPADGWFNIKINNASGQSKTLSLGADGSFCWGGSNVVTESQGTAKTATKLIGDGADDLHHIKFDWGRQSEGYLGATVDKTDIGLLLTDKNYLNHTVCRPTDTGLTTGFGASFTTPAGGTWMILCYLANYNSTSIGARCWIRAGGTTLTLDSTVSRSVWWAWRIS